MDNGGTLQPLLKPQSQQTRWQTNPRIEIEWTPIETDLMVQWVRILLWKILETEDLKDSLEICDKFIYDSLIKNSDYE